MNSSANVLDFVDFNVHHQDRHILVELMDLVNYVNDLTYMVNSPTWIPDCDSLGSALSDFFLFSDTGICSTVVFLPLRSGCLSFH